MLANIYYIFPKFIIDLVKVVRAWFIFLLNFKSISKNKEVKNTKVGEKVYVIANGPSLKKIDHKKLKDIDVIVMNNFDLCEWKNEVNIVAHCIGEPINSSHWGMDQIEISNNTNAQSYWYHYSVKNEVLGYKSLKKNIPFYFMMPLIPESIFVSNKINLAGLTLGYSTTAQMAIIVAIYMGYKEIRLLGFDHDMLKNRNISPHFYVEGKGAVVVDKTNEPYLSLMTRCVAMWKRYYKIKKVAQEKNIEIINETKNTFLDVFKYKL